MNTISAEVLMKTIDAMKDSVEEGWKKNYHPLPEGTKMMLNLYGEEGRSATINPTFVDAIKIIRYVGTGYGQSDNIKLTQNYMATYEMFNASIPIDKNGVPAFVKAQAFNIGTTLNAYMRTTNNTFGDVTIPKEIPVFTVTYELDTERDTVTLSVSIRLPIVPAE